MPGGKVGGEEEGGDGDGDGQRLLRGQCTGWPEHPGDRPQEGQRQRQPPEAGRDRPDPAVRTRNGPPASARLPSSRAAKASGWDLLAHTPPLGEWGAWKGKRPTP